MTNQLFCVRTTTRIVYVGHLTRCTQEAEQLGPGHTIEPFNTHRSRTGVGMKETS